eukprot:1181862-Prorocentrum_minimum.AAC.1
MGRSRGQRCVALECVDESFPAPARGRWVGCEAFPPHGGSKHRPRWICCRVGFERVRVTRVILCNK